MPLPKPRPNEKQREFISRCIVDSNIQKEGKDTKQRIAICYEIYRKN